MQCKNHPGSSAADRCAGCAEAFCRSCLVEILGKSYCAGCKSLTLHGRTQPMLVEQAMLPCKEAGGALNLAILGLLLWFSCIGLILGPLAIAKASTAKRMIEMNPRLSGSGKANAAMILGIIDLVVEAAVLILNAAAKARHL